jgi:hypothetical protein
MLKSQGEDMEWKMNGLFTPNIIDIEASGFGSNSYPIEVGVVNQLGEKFCRLVKPQAGWCHWDTQAEKLHGISREMLMQKGVSVKLICTELNAFLDRQTVYSDGWVVDNPWLIKLYQYAQMNMTFRISPLEMILTESQMTLWHSTKNQVSRAMNIRRHRASSDAALIQTTFVQTRALDTLVS